MGESETVLSDIE